MDDLGTLVEIEDLREVWPSEAYDFTPWLADHIEVLGRDLGIGDIKVEETESPVGDFNVDILAVDIETGGRIVIENQLEDTDHDHLGKLITYAAGKSAKLAIWVVRNAREEHRAAIEWLNFHTSEDIGFVLCEIKVYRIGDSKLAPKFIVIEQPNGWSKKMKPKRMTYPNIKEMLEMGIVSAGDILVAKGTEEEAELLESGLVSVNGTEMSLHHWLSDVTGWSSVQTYNQAIHKKTGKLLSDLR